MIADGMGALYQLGDSSGKWKLVSQTHDSWRHATPGTWELYDMEADRTEMNDLPMRIWRARFGIWN